MTKEELLKLGAVPVKSSNGMTREQLVQMGATPFGQSATQAPQAPKPPEPLVPDNPIAQLGDPLIAAGKAFSSVLTGPLATAGSAVRGLWNLGKFGVAKAQGKDEKASAIMEKEAQAQVRERSTDTRNAAKSKQELALTNEVPPAKNMLEALGQGTKLGVAALAAPYTAWLSTLPGATPSLVGLVSGGASGLGTGIGLGLEKSGKEDAGIQGTLDNVGASGTFGGTLGMGLGYGLGKLNETSAAKLEKQREKAKELVGRITRTTKRKLDRNIDAVSSFDSEDLKDIKDFKDLQAASDARIKVLKTAVDKEMGQNPDRIPMDKFTTTYSEGKQAFTDNPITRSLDQLDELYQKTNNPTARAAVLSMQQKAKAEGLTAIEINDLARKYGSEFRAFNPSTGNQSTSVTKIGYENTRSDLKDVARSLLPNDKAKALDEQMGNLITLRESVAKMDENVTKLVNRVSKRNLVEKITRLAGKGINAAFFGGPRSLITSLLFPSNVGLKTMNYLDTQSQLTSNIVKANNLLQLSDTQLVNELTKMTKAAINLIPVVVGGLQGLKKR